MNLRRTRLSANGISIPSSYTAHLAPLSSSRLYNEVAASQNVLQGSETPYVVMFQAVNILSADGGGTSGQCGPQVQECWEFDCPRKDAVIGKRGKKFLLEIRRLVDVFSIRVASDEQS